MGVPALFRWLASKYPRIVEPVIEEGANAPTDLGSNHEQELLPSAMDLEGPNPNGVEFDNLYLDMNGIIHPCTHPEGRPAPETEAAMMAEIFAYIDRIFSMIRPRKVLYLAVDGVAPRAKMNQQRSRRFRAALEAAQKAAKEVEIQRELGPGKLKEKHENEDGDSSALDDSKSPFDSNCITPGTPFMNFISQGLRYYILSRMNSDRAWQSIQVLFSDASVPGEGEHKIMDFIRRQRLQPDYNPNTRHVIYGLDADLIMLSMGTHEPHFKVLREDVFAQDKKCFKCGQAGHFAEACTVPSSSVLPKSVENINKPFIFLDILMLRGYLDAELRSQAGSIRALYNGNDSGSVTTTFNGIPTDRFDLERAIDDWIFLCFFVGNDFLPHLPCLELREGAIDMLLDLYKANWSRMGGYITTDGQVDLNRVRIMMEEVGKIEELVFRKRREREEKRLEREKRNREMERDLPEAKRRHLVGYSDVSTKERSRGFVSSTTAFIHPVRQDANIVSQENTRLVQQRFEERNKNIVMAQSLRDELNRERNQANKSKDQSSIENDKDKSPMVDSDRDKSPIVDSDKDKGSTMADDDNVKLWEPGAKERYYWFKFGIDLQASKEEEQICSKDRVDKIMRAYVEGLCWVMQYYSQGVPSWKWFYPYHYAPFASDISQRVVQEPISFELGEPFRPFDQLMSVFPAASKQHIPSPFHHLMTSVDSKVIDFYPETFHIDLNGKRQAWQGVALLPFIDEERLLTALEPIYSQLGPEQIELNQAGATALFVCPKSKHDELAFLAKEKAVNSAGSVTGIFKRGKLETNVQPPTDATNAIIPKAQPITDSKIVEVEIELISPKDLNGSEKNLFTSRLLEGVKTNDEYSQKYRLSPEERAFVASGQASRQYPGRLDIFGQRNYRGEDQRSFRPTNGGRQYHSMHQEYASKLDIDRYQQEQRFGKRNYRNDEVLPQESTRHDQRSSANRHYPYSLGSDSYGGKSNYQANHSGWNRAGNTHTNRFEALRGASRQDPRITDLDKKYPPPSTSPFQSSNNYYGGFDNRTSLYQQPAISELYQPPISELYQPPTFVPQRTGPATDKQYQDEPGNSTSKSNTRDKRDKNRQ